MRGGWAVALSTCARAVALSPPRPLAGLAAPVASADKPRAIARATDDTLGLVFPGGGIYFWWQAGAITALARRVDLAHTPCAGASAGALAATLAACECDMDAALDHAIGLCTESGAFERGPWGLYGIWGGIIEQWLDDLLPADAAERCRGRVSLAVNEARLPLRNVAVSDFADRADLCAASMASVHVPLFLDGRPTSPFRGTPCIDGSFLCDRGRLVPPGCARAVTIHSDLDARMRAGYRKPADFLRLLEPEAVRAMMRRGEEYVEQEAVPGGALAALLQR